MNKTLTGQEKKAAHVHLFIAKTALEAVNELYDVTMSNNVFYEAWKAQHPGLSAKGLRNAFARRNISKCIPFARATLAHMLESPIDPAYKEQIMEALALDASLIRGRANPPAVLGMEQS